jgi:glycosyltransferase involved in cell wall biosynthesis
MSALALGNEAARDGKPDIARQHYATALLEQPALAEVVFGNLLRLHRYSEDSRDSYPVVVAGYELGHNAAGRAAVLAELYSRAGHEVLLLGPTVAPYRDLWAPIRQSPLRRRLCALESFSDVLTGLIPLVASQPASVVHLSKARGPNLLTGALYKLFWNATVLIDVDDEELGFVGAASPISFAEWATLPESQRSIDTIIGRQWTRLAVGLIDHFDGVTVANTALQDRYRGSLIHHARDESQWIPAIERRDRSRARWGIPPDGRIALFFGTPRAHKGLLETAQALASIPGRPWQLLIVGDFENVRFQSELQSIGEGLVRCIPGQPFAEIPDILALADVCILLQQGSGQAAQLQTPAKLTDALAMRIPVLATETQGLRDFINAKAVFPTTVARLPQDLTALWDQPDSAARRSTLIERGRQIFDEELSYRVNAERLQTAMYVARQSAISGSDILRWAPVQVLGKALKAS